MEKYSGHFELNNLLIVRNCIPISDNDKNDFVVISITASPASDVVHLTIYLLDYNILSLASANLHQTV